MDINKLHNFWDNHKTGEKIPGEMRITKNRYF